MVRSLNEKEDKLIDEIDGWFDEYDLKGKKNEKILLNKILNNKFLMNNVMMLKVINGKIYNYDYDLRVSKNKVIGKEVSGKEVIDDLRDEMNVVDVVGGF